MEAVTLDQIKEDIFRSCKRGIKHACIRYRGKNYHVFSSYYTERSSLLSVPNDFYFTINNRRCPTASYTRVTYFANRV